MSGRQRACSFEHAALPANCVGVLSLGAMHAAYGGLPHVTKNPTVYELNLDMLACIGKRGGRGHAGCAAEISGKTPRLHMPFDCFGGEGRGLMILCVECGCPGSLLRDVILQGVWSSLVAGPTGV